MYFLYRMNNLNACACIEREREREREREGKGRERWWRRREVVVVREIGKILKEKMGRGGEMKAEEDPNSGIKRAFYFKSNLINV